jgi:uncharacterized protein (UPF0218 family)
VAKEELLEEMEIPAEERLLEMVVATVVQEEVVLLSQPQQEVVVVQVDTQVLEVLEEMQTQLLAL